MGDRSDRGVNRVQPINSQTAVFRETLIQLIRPADNTRFVCLVLFYIGARLGVSRAFFFEVLIIVRTALF
jgi:hypothetical protein